MMSHLRDFSRDGKRPPKGYEGLGAVLAKITVERAETTAVEVEEESDAAFDESGALGLSLAPLGRQLVRYLLAFFIASVCLITRRCFERTGGARSFTEIIFEKTVGTCKNLGHL